MACNINAIKTGCSVKNVHISQFQNLQIKFNLHISVCQRQIKINKAYPEALICMSDTDNMKPAKLTFL